MSGCAVSAPSAWLLVAAFVLLFATGAWMIWLHGLSPLSIALLAIIAFVGVSLALMGYIAFVGWRDRRRPSNG